MNITKLIITSISQRLPALASYLLSSVGVLS
jgi:hypothetical protein